MLEAMEKAANHLYACELVPMIIPPTARIMARRNMDGRLLPLDEIKAPAVELATVQGKPLGK